LGASDHGRVQIDTGHLEPVVAGQPDRQVAGSAAGLQDPRPVGRDRRDVGRDALEQRAEQESVAHRVVQGGIPDEDPTGYRSAHGTAGVPEDKRAGRGGSAEDDEGSRSGDHEALEVGRAKKWSPLCNSTCASSGIGSFPPCTRR
jgi:hypothetical protein